MHKSIKKWKILKNTKKHFFSIFLKNFLLPFFQLFGQFRVYKSNLIFQISPFLKNLTHLTVLKIRKKLKKFFSKKYEKIFFCIFYFFLFWSDLYTQNHDQQFVSCLIFMIMCEKSMWYAHPLHTKAYKNSSLRLDTL